MLYCYVLVAFFVLTFSSRVTFVSVETGDIPVVSATAKRPRQREGGLYVSSGTDGNSEGEAEQA